MADPVVIVFAGEPVAKGRPRFVSRGGKATAYTPQKTRSYETALAWAAKQAMDGRPLLVGPVTMSIVASLPIPPSWPDKKQQQAARGEIVPVVKPDVDNFSKLVGDACNCVVFLDDKQVVFQTVSKRYSKQPGLRIEIASFKAEAA